MDDRKNSFLEMVLYLVGWGLIIASFVLYFVFYDRLETMTKFVKAIMPIILVLAIGIIMVTRRRKKLRRRKEAGDYEDVLRVPSSLRVKIDLISYGVVIIILIVGYLLDKKISGGDIGQAIFAYLGMYIITRMIYH